MINEIKPMLDRYVNWLKDEMPLRQIGDDWVEITTPHLDRHNDCLQFYMRKDGNGYLLTDDGFCINDLLSSGCAMDTPKRQTLLKTTLAGFGVKQEGNELLIKATADSFPLKTHNLVQAMLAVNDLFYLAYPYINSLFYEEVMEWLDSAEIRYMPKIKLTGKSGYDYVFDFIIPKSSYQPERVIEAVNKPRKDSVERLLHKWSDTRNTRASDMQAYPLLNDNDNPVPQQVISALENYDLIPVLWSKKEEYRELLAA